MAKTGVHLDQRTFSCSICLDLLKDPVTASCGHSFCRNCISTHWDTEDEEINYSCPHCRKTFLLRPVLEKSIMLATLVEELKETGLQTEDVVCDICTGRKQKATKSCHDIVLGAAERMDSQKDVEVRRLNIQQGIQDRERDLNELQQEVKAIKSSADKAIQDSEKVFIQLIRLLEKRWRDVKQQVRSQQEAQVGRVKELQKKLKQQIAELKRKEAEVEELSHTVVHNQFLHNYPSLSAFSGSPQSSVDLHSLSIRPLRYFEEVPAAVSRVRDRLQENPREEWTTISLTEVDVLQPEPEMRAGILRYSSEISLDPNTANRRLLSERDRKITFMDEDHFVSQHTEGFF